MRFSKTIFEQLISTQLISLNQNVNSLKSIWKQDSESTDAKMNELRHQISSSFASVASFIAPIVQNLLSSSVSLLGESSLTYSITNSLDPSLNNSIASAPVSASATTPNELFNPTSGVQTESSQSVAPPKVNSNEYWLIL